MDFLELCKTRQSCRAFTGQKIEHEKLVKLVEAGRNAPSACNSQPWRFIVVENKDLFPEIAKCGQLTGNAFTSDAGAFIIILEEHAVLMPAVRPMIEPQHFAKFDIGAAATYICLEAAQLGLGACHIGFFDREKLSQLLNLPRDQRYGGFIALGYPKDEIIREKKRKSMDDVAQFV